METKFSNARQELTGIYRTSHGTIKHFTVSTGASTDDFPNPSMHPTLIRVVEL